MDIQAWSDFLTAHGPWLAFTAALLAALICLLRRMAAVQDRAWDALDANTKAIGEFSTLLRERLPR